MDPATLILSLITGIACAGGAGALSGMKLAGEDLGNELASYMGALYGLIAGGSATVIGLIALMLIG